MTLIVLGLVSSAHLAAVGLATLGPLWCVWLRWYGRRGKAELVDHLARRLALHSLVGLVGGMLLGGLLLMTLWFATDGGFFRAARLVPPSRFWFGAVEAAFSLLCLGAYWIWWPDSSRRLRAGSHTALALLGTTNLAYHFPTLFAVTGLYAAQPHLAEAGFRQAMLHPEVPARTVHFLLAGMLLSGLWACRLARQMQPDTALQRSVVAAARGLLAAAMLQIVSGAALLGALAAPARDALLGGSLATTALLGLSVLATVLLLHRLAAMALGDADPALPSRALRLTAGIILLMCAARQTQRHQTGLAAVMRPLGVARLSLAAQRREAPWQTMADPNGDDGTAHCCRAGQARCMAGTRT